MTYKNLSTKIILSIKQLWCFTAALFLPLLLLFSSSALALSGFENIGSDFMLRRGVDTASLANVLPALNGMESNSEPLILIPEPQASSTVNSNYQYEAEDVDALLRLRICEERFAGNINLDNIVLLPHATDVLGYLEYRLQEEHYEYFNSIVERERAPHERTIVVPLQLMQLSHWVGIVIRLDDASSILSINYIDSLGGSMPDVVRESVQNVYKFLVCFEAIKFYCQRLGDS